MSWSDERAHDLLFGLVALECGLIDGACLAAAFRTWMSDPTQSMAATLSDQPGIDRSGRDAIARVIALLAAGQGGRSLPGDSRVNAGAAGPGDTATVAYQHAERPAADHANRAGAGGPRYQILSKHATGGLGEIWLAIDPELDRQVALKELREFHADDPVSQSRFVLEAKLTGRLEHPGIVPVYGLGRHADGRPYYAMRFIEGQTLQQAIERFHEPRNTGAGAGARAMAFRRLLRSLIDACNAVAYAHSRGVVHRDLKPENIMLGRFGETLVLDWGIAKPSVAAAGGRDDDAGALGDLVDQALTRPGSAIGTPRYMSPEQAAGDLDRVGPASDVFSLGATLYCILVGHGPFSTVGFVDLFERVRRGIFLLPRQVDRSIDPALEAVCLKAMSLDPEDRHASPAALAEEIEAWLANIRYQGEQVHALADVKRTLVRLAIERAHHFLGKGMPGEGKLWLMRALENLPADSPGLDRVVRTTLGAWHAASKGVIRAMNHGGEILAVAFSPDGRRLASTSGDHSIQIWDMAKGAPLSARMRLGGKVPHIAFSHDGRLVGTACDDGTVALWDGVTGEVVVGPIGLRAPATSIQFSPDDARFAIAGDSPCLFVTASGRPVGADHDGGGPALAVAFHPDGSVLAQARADGQICFRETSTGAVIDPPLEAGAAVTAIAFSPDGSKLAVLNGGGQATLWLVDGRAPLMTFRWRSERGVFELSPTGRSIALLSHDGRARLCDAHSGRTIGEPLAHHGPIDCLAFSHDGTLIATGGRDGTARLWDGETALPLGPPLTHKGAVGALAFSPDGKRLATAGSDGMVRCWRVPAAVAGDVERISCWIRVTTELEFDEGDATRPIDPAALWELRRRLQVLGGAPVR